MPKPSTFLTGPNYGLQDVRNKSIRQALGNRVFDVMTLTLETDANDIQTSNAFDYSIDNVIYTQSIVADENVTAADFYGDTAVQAADTTCWYVFCTDSAQAITGYKGKDDETSLLPGVPDDLCVFGLVKIVTVAVTFELGVTDYSASGVTDTFYDISGSQPSTAPS